MLGFFVQNVLSQAELRNLAEQFRTFDKDGSGALSPNELKQALLEVQGIDFNERDMETLIKRIDVDGDGEINYSEFLMASLNRTALITGERLENAFRRFDLDGNGEISVKELKAMLNLVRPMDEAAVLKAMKEIDGKSKATLQFSEFKALM